MARDPAPNGRILLTQSEVDAMDEYSMTMPAGPSPGRYWKRDMNVFCKYGPNPDWVFARVMKEKYGNGHAVEWKEITIIEEGWVDVSLIGWRFLIEKHGLPHRERGQLPKGRRDLGDWQLLVFEVPQWVKALVAGIPAAVGEDEQTAILDASGGQHAALSAAFRLGGARAMLKLLREVRKR